MAHSSPAPFVSRHQNTSSNLTADLWEYLPNTTTSVHVCLLQRVYHRDLTQIVPVTATIVIFYVIVAVLAILGNILVIWTVWRNNHMHTVTNYYIVNLAISDLLVASLVMPLKLLEYTGDCRWQVFTSDGLCSVVSYLLPIVVFASVLTLAAISMERYYAIVHPLTVMKINSKSRTRKIIATTWIVPIVVASPFIFCHTYAFTIYSEYGLISRQICNDRFDEIDMALYNNDPSRKGEFRKGYFLFLFCVIYLIPSTVILTTCVKIAISLLKPISDDDSIFGRKDTSRRHEENKRKVARMVIVIAVAFIVSWSPQYLVSIISQLQEQSFLRESNYIFTMLITHFFGFVNSCLNPIIYTAMSTKFRRSFKEIGRRVCFCFSCRALLTYTPSYGRGSAQRYTSTMRHTLSETDGNNIPMNDSMCPNDNYYANQGQKKCSRSSSSGAESDVRSYQELCNGDKMIIKKYVFKNNSSAGTIGNSEDSDKPLLTGSTSDSPNCELKGILKTSKPDRKYESNSDSSLIRDTVVKSKLGRNMVECDQSTLCFVRDTNPSLRAMYTS